MSSSPRFIIATCEGHLKFGHSAPGRSVSVLDTLDAHRVIATYRSEDFQPVPAQLRNEKGRYAKRTFRIAHATALVYEHAARLERENAA